MRSLPRPVVPLAVAAAVVAGVVARFVTTSPLWLDEALSVNIAALPLGDIVDALRHDGHPPLYYWLLHGWMALFGSGDVAARSLSGVLSILTIPLVGAAGHRLAGRAGMAWAVVALALSPYAVRYATEARMYSLVMLLVAAGYLLVLRVLDRGGALPVAALAVVVSALLWTHYWALYLLATTGLILLLRWWRRPDVRAGATRALGALIAGGLLFAPWLPVLLDQAGHTGTPWALPSRPTTILSVTLDDLGGGSFAEARLYGIALAALALIGAFAVTAGPGGGLLLQSHPHRRLRDVLLVIVGTFALGSAMGYVSAGAYASRYAAVVVPLILLTAAVGLAQLPPGWLRVGLAGSLVVFGIVGIGHNARVDRTQAQDLAEVIAADAGPGDLIVTCPDQLAPSLQRAVHEDVPGLTVRPYPTGDPRFVDWRDYAERNDAADPAAFADRLVADAGPGAIWVVWNGTYRSFEGDCEALVSRLGALRSGSVVRLAGTEFEAANLSRFTG